MDNYTDALTRLIDRARTGDNRAIRDVLDVYTPIWRRQLLKLGLPDCDAQDVLSELYVAVWTTIGDLKHAHGFSTYYKKRLVWLVGEHRRMVRRLPTPLSSQAEWDDIDGDKLACLIDYAAVDPCAEVIQQEERLLLANALDGLASINAAQAAAIRAHYLEDRSYDDIAVEHGVPVGTVRSRLHNGRERLRKLLLAA